ncbi:MAG: pilus assembly protein TadG-related protein [Actinomycetota bacterium]
MRRLLRDETGSTIPLIVGFAALALALIFTVVAASSLYLERKRLFDLADGAALSGAEAFDIDDVVTTPSGPRPVLRSSEVADAVRAYLANAPTGDLAYLQVIDADTADGKSATVTLSARWRPPVFTMLGQDGFPVRVTVIARSVFG